MKQVLTTGTKVIFSLFLIGSLALETFGQKEKLPRFARPYVRKENVRILGLAVHDDSGIGPVLFFPDKWNPIDSLRFGLPKGISMFSSKIKFHQICNEGFKRYGLCFWECALEIPPASYMRLASEPKWFRTEFQQFVMNSGVKSVGMRSILLANCHRHPDIELILQARHGEGKEARSFRNLKLKL
jgi:hypothetical protein